MTIRDPLPRHAQPLIGRERETEELRAMLLDRKAHRSGSIVTIVGPGGVGKTRLAIRVATLLFDHLRDGAVFVPLVSVEDSNLLFSSIADALELAGVPIPEVDVAQRVHSALEHRSIVIVLDNVEQIRGCAERLATLVTQVPNVLWLVTSRSPLHLAGETVFPLAPLPIPTTNDPLATRASPSVQLFASCAQQASATFEITETNLPAVSEICRRLGGLPLAIELAAARIRSFGPEAMTHVLERATGALDLPEGGSTYRSHRHASIREAVAWSSSLLTPSAYRLFLDLSVIPGNFGPDTAEIVGGGDASGSSLRDLERLVEASLVSHRLETEGKSRYELLQPVREFARERLEHGGGVIEATRRLIEWGVRFSNERTNALLVTDHMAWMASVHAEIDTLRAAYGAALQRGEAEAALRMIAFALWQYWGIRGQLRDEGEVIDRAIALAEESPAAIPTTVLAAGYSQQALRSSLIGDVESADRAYRRALELREELNDPGPLANTLNNYGLMLLAERRYGEARITLERSLVIRRELGQPRRIALALMNLGDLAILERDVEAARRWLDEALTISEDSGDYLAVGYALMNLGEVALLANDGVEALSMAEQGLALVRHVGETRGISQALDIAARSARALGRLRQAMDFLAEAVEINLRSGQVPPAASNLEQIASLLELAGAVTGAIFLLGIASELHARRASAVPEQVKASIARLRAAHPGSAFLIPWGDGRALPVERIGEEIARIAELIPETRDPPALSATSRSAVEALATLRGRAIDPLTPREADVLALLIEGKSDREIADALALSIRTVSNHMYRLLDKLGVRSRTAAASLAIRIGLAR